MATKQLIDEIAAALVQRADATSKRLLSDHHAAAKRTAQRAAAEQLVDAAIADGRVPLPQRDAHLRMFEIDFDTTAKILARRAPNSSFASRNYFATDGRENEYRADAGRRLGIPDEQVI